MTDHAERTLNGVIRGADIESLKAHIRALRVKALGGIREELEAAAGDLQDEDPAGLIDAGRALKALGERVLTIARELNACEIELRELEGEPS